MASPAPYSARFLSQFVGKNVESVLAEYDAQQLDDHKAVYAVAISFYQVDLRVFADLDLDGDHINVTAMNCVDSLPCISAETFIWQREPIRVGTVRSIGIAVSEANRPLAICFECDDASLRFMNSGNDGELQIGHSLNELDTIVSYSWNTVP